MAENIFKPIQTTNSKISSLTKVAGQFIITTDAPRQVYLDIDASTRVLLYSGSITNIELVDNSLKITTGDNTTTTISLPDDTDTKNTAGATQSASKLFLVGATAQTANPQTYSQSQVYAQSGKIYSNSKEVVNLSDSQALTNKTYNGYTLAAAAAKGVDTTLELSSTSTNLPTSQAVADAINNAIPADAQFTDYKMEASSSEPTSLTEGDYWFIIE